MLPGWIFSPVKQRFVQIAIIVGVLLISLAIGIVPGSRLGLGVVGLAIVAAGSFFLLRRLTLGLVLIIVSAMVIPTLDVRGFGGYLIPPILLVAALLGLWFFDMLAHYRRLKFVRSRTILPAVVLVAVSLIAFVNGQILYNNFAQLAPVQAQLGGVAVFFISMAAFLLVANLVTEVVWLQRMVWVFIVLGGIYIITRLIPDEASISKRIFQYGSDASMFWIWLIAMLSSQALFNPHLAKRQRWALFAVLATTLYVSLVPAYTWKSGWLPSIVALFVIVWIGIPRFRVAATFLGIAAFTLYLLFGGVQLFTGGEDYSIMTRSEAWLIVLEIAKINPIIGLGMSNYFWYTPLFAILGYRGINFSSHNNYIDLIAQMGIIGLGVFIWLAFEIARLGWKLLNIVPEGFPRAYVIGALGGLAGTLFSGLLGDWFLPFVYNVGLHGMRSSLIGWIFLGGLVALEQIYQVRQDEVQGE